MPDIQTALKSTLREWDDAPPPAPAPNEPAKFNLSRALFDYVLNNPGKPSYALTNEMVRRGGKASSITSLLAQFVKSRIIESRDGCYYAVATEYRSPNAARALYAKRPVKSKPKAKHAAPVAAPAPAPKAKVSPMVFSTADDILATLPVREAHTLYLRLKEMFAP